MNQANKTNPVIGSSKAEKNAKIFIITASIAIPVIVVILNMMPKIQAGSGSLRSWLNELPTVNATLNGTTALLLIAAFAAIRAKNIKLHKRLMTTALALSILFILTYVTYHATTESTPYPIGAPNRDIYIIILLSHIFLSAIVVPLVLISYSRALAEKFDKHKKLARITLPIWLYVAITGVIVYLMISPYYPF